MIPKHTCGDFRLGCYLGIILVVLCCYSTIFSIVSAQSHHVSSPLLTFAPPNTPNPCPRNQVTDASDCVPQLMGVDGTMLSQPVDGQIVNFQDQDEISSNPGEFMSQGVDVVSTEPALGASMPHHIPPSPPHTSVVINSVPEDESVTFDDELESNSIADLEPCYDNSEECSRRIKPMYYYTYPSYTYSSGSYSTPYTGGTYYSYPSTTTTTTPTTTTTSSSSNMIYYDSYGNRISEADYNRLMGRSTNTNTNSNTNTNTNTNNGLTGSWSWDPLSGRYTWRTNNDNVNINGDSSNGATARWMYDPTTGRWVRATTEAAAAANPSAPTDSSFDDNDDEWVYDYNTRRWRRVSNSDPYRNSGSSTNRSQPPPASRPNTPTAPTTTTNTTPNTNYVYWDATTRTWTRTPPTTTTTNNNYRTQPTRTTTTTPRSADTPAPGPLVNANQPPATNFGFADVEIPAA